jgi:dTDP-4-amino-4,6-dideoxygalactose transaminase
MECFMEDDLDHARERIFLSPPHLGGDEEALVRDAFSSNWVAPLGPHVDAFEREFADTVGARDALALSSGTAALHLALILCGVRPGDTVFVSTFTFAASANPIRYLGAEPVFIDSEPNYWNMDPDLLRTALAEAAAAGRVPKAVIVVHLYGQSADLDPICAVANEYGVPVIEDAAEALGATYRGEAPGTAGRFGVYSFNGNKIITTSGGGMLVGRNPNELDHARKLSSQARESAPHYEHREVGYNYRLSNILAAIGRGQLRVLEDRVLARRRLFEVYSTALGDIEGITFAPEAPWGRHTRWLTTVLIDPARFGTDREAVRASLEDANIEARPLWKPMHTQPVYRGCTSHGGSVSEALFRDGLCLPSGSAMTEADIGRVVAEIRRCAAGRTPVAAAGATHGA